MNYERKPYDRDNLILYLETCLVDNQGCICPARMNNVDWDIMEELKKEGLIDYGRLPSEYIRNQKQRNFNLRSHWIEFNEQTWDIAYKLRKEKAKRTCEKFNNDIKIGEK